MERLWLWSVSPLNAEAAGRTVGAWRETPRGLKASYGNREGWTGMFFALKGWIEHGLNLRQGTCK